MCLLPLDATGKKIDYINIPREEARRRMKILA
jgi:hypothetical protein